MKITLGGINNRSDSVGTKVSEFKNIKILLKMKHREGGNGEKSK